MSFWDGIWRSEDGTLFPLDKRDDVSYNLGSAFSITRGGNDIAFASHGGGHPTGDVCLHPVNDNACLDNGDLRIVKT